jgi:hypothetical protein
MLLPEIVAHGIAKSIVARWIQPSSHWVICASAQELVARALWGFMVVAAATSKATTFLMFFITFHSFLRPG